MILSGALKAAETVLSELRYVLLSGYFPFANPIKGCEAVCRFRLSGKSPSVVQTPTQGNLFRVSFVPISKVANYPKSNNTALDKVTKRRGKKVSNWVSSLLSKMAFLFTTSNTTPPQSLLIRLFEIKTNIKNFALELTLVFGISGLLGVVAGLGRQKSALSEQPLVGIHSVGTTSI